MHRTPVAHPRPVHEGRCCHPDLVISTRPLHGEHHPAMVNARTSPLEAAISHANISWPTVGVASLLSPGGEPNGGKWPECCGFVVLPESQPQWLIVRHGSINVVPVAIGLKDHGPNLALRAVAPPQICGAQRIQSPLASDADSSLTGFRPVGCPLRLRVDEALSSYREYDRDWSDAWRTHQSCSSGRHATLISHFYADREPPHEFLEQSPLRSRGPALHSEWRSRRPTDKLQILSWNPGPARGSDPSLLSSHLKGPWHVICIQSGLVSSLTVPWRRTSM